MKGVVGIGSNEGDRFGALQGAVERLSEVLRVEEGSRVYETAPVGGPPQDDFLNAAVLVETELSPLALLDALQAIEHAMGRVRREHWGPRVIDLDILWIEGLTVDDPRCTVPHPLLVERSFALVPLLELVPDATDPRTGHRYASTPAGRAMPSDPALRPTAWSLVRASRSMPRAREA